MVSAAVFPHLLGANADPCNWERAISAVVLEPCDAEPLGWFAAYRQASGPLRIGASLLAARAERLERAGYAAPAMSMVESRLGRALSWAPRRGYRSPSVPPVPAFPTALRLRNFRSYEAAELRGLPCGPIVLSGPNGAGKTNLLEAVSFLSPGRGMRRAPAREVQNRDKPEPWAVWAQIGPARVGTGMNPETGRRRVRIDGQNGRSAAALAAHMACVWLTPAMDRLFSGASSGRRQFLDRLIFALDPDHAARVGRYEVALAQRVRLLKEGGGDAAWLSGLEATMAQAAVAVAAARLDFVERLDRDAAAPRAGDFPCARLEYDPGPALGGLTQGQAALAVEEALRDALAAGRGVDRASGRCAVGAHRGDLIATFSGTPAGQGSTGEQKALLIGLVLAHARLIAAERGTPPVLLLDEVAAHLDPERRAALFSMLAALGAQVWMTGTEPALFDPLRGSARMLFVCGAQITDFV